MNKENLIRESSPILAGKIAGIVLAGVGKRLI